MGIERADIRLVEVSEVRRDVPEEDIQSRLVTHNGSAGFVGLCGVRFAGIRRKYPIFGDLRVRLFGGLANL